MTTPLVPRLASIVAIDDQESNLRLLRVYLQSEPYRLIGFTDPHLALKAIEQNPPDLVLLDLMMPVMDGYSMLELLRDAVPKVPVVVVTALDDRDARLRGLASGARDFLTKPLDRTELQIRVRNLVALKQSRDALEDALAELQSLNRDLQAFAGGLAHDLQQPLSTIAAFAQVMQDHAEQLPPADAGHVGRILRSTAVARQMIKALLEFARLGQADVEMVPVDLNKIVADARSQVTTETGVQSVEWHIAQLPTVQGDAQLLSFAFVNLLSNAVKYSSKNEHPVVWVEARALALGAYEITVRDNGVGFDMNYADKLFSPFKRLHTTSEFEGTGMGLANVRRIMERHGGTIHAESELGKGAVFTVTLNT